MIRVQRQESRNTWPTRTTTHNNVHGYQIAVMKSSDDRIQTLLLELSTKSSCPHTGKDNLDNNGDKVNDDEISCCLHGNTMKKHGPAFLISMKSSVSTNYVQL